MFCCLRLFQKLQWFSWGGISEMILTVIVWFLLLLRIGVSCSSPHQTGQQVRACGRDSNGSLSCPDSCSCEDDKGVVCYGDNTTATLNLSNLNLIAVPRFEGIYPSLTTLNLSANSIVCLHDGELTSEKFPSLEVLDLSCNKLKSVGNQVMLLPSLLELDLSWNRLRQLNFLASEDALSLSLAVNVSQNSLVCEELEKSLILLCSRYQNHTEDVSCADKVAATDINVSTSEKTLTQLCSNMSHDVSGGDLDFSITTVGVAVGGVVMLTAVVTVSTVFLIFVCLKASSRHQESSPIVRHHTSTSSSPHSAPPPTVPPLPPPQEIRRPTTNPGDIYAEPNESRMTGLSRDSKDYEDGYILNVESVPSRRLTDSNKKFGLLAAVTGLQPPPFRTPPILAPAEYSVASVLPGQQQQQQVDKTPTEPKPYSVPTTANKNAHTGSAGAPRDAKKKPPVKPRKSKSLKKAAAVVEGGATAATEICSDRPNIRSDRPRGKTFAGSPKRGISRRVDEWEQRRKTEVRRAPEEGSAATSATTKQGTEYLKVVL